MNNEYYKQGYEQGISDILDKIRKEIVKKEIALNCTEVSNIAKKIAYIEILKIINKYKTESGGEE